MDAEPGDAHARIPERPLRRETFSHVIETKTRRSPGEQELRDRRAEERSREQQIPRSGGEAGKQSLRRGRLQ